MLIFPACNTLQNICLNGLHWPPLRPTISVLNAQQPGTVLKRLNARQSDNFTEFTLKVLSSFLRVLNVSLAMSSDPKNYFVFLVDEISEPGLTIKWLFLDTEKFRRKPNSKYSHYEFRLKASFKPIKYFMFL